MITRFHLLAVLAGGTALVVSTPLAAAELVQRDVQLLLYAPPTAYDFALSAGNLQADADDSFDAGLGLEVGGRWSFTRPGDAYGLVVGAALQVEDKSGGDTNLFSIGLRPSVGFGWALTDAWTAVAEVGLAYGLSTLSTDASGASQGLNASGHFLAYDLRLVALWQATRQVLIEVHVGYVSASHEVSDGGIDVTLDQSGIYAGLGVVWRFSDAPARLE